MQQTAELLAVTRMDKGMKVEVQDCFGSWARSCDEAEVALEQKHVAEEELKQYVLGTDSKKSRSRGRKRLAAASRQQHQGSEIGCGLGSRIDRGEGQWLGPEFGETTAQTGHHRRRKHTKTGKKK